jgi:prepilin-type N-terminal cleavage/methylation domain-containing protein
MKLRARSGFTLVELLTVVVLASFLLLVIYQVLITNSRAYTVSNAQIQGQQMLRAGTEILFGELREISAQSGDLLEMGESKLTVRAQRGFGLVCEANYAVSPPKLSLFNIGRAFEVGDSVFVFHDNDPNTPRDDEWFGGVVTVVDTATACGGYWTHQITVPSVGTTAAASPPDSVRAGAPVRGFDTYTYGQYEIYGEAYLGRQLKGSGSPDPLVGPLIPEGGLTFRYLDSLGAATTVDTLVAQIEVVLRYQADVRSFDDELVTDSLTVRVFPRN